MTREDTYMASISALGARVGIPLTALDVIVVIVDK